MLLDAWMPEYDFSEYHSTVIRARPPVVYDALMTVDLVRHPLPLALLALRALPAALLGRRRQQEFRRSLTLRDVAEHGFVFLAEQAPHEVVLGVTGPFWKLGGGIIPTAVQEFRDTPPPATARAAWNFVLMEQGEQATLLSTETRILCADADARRSFGRYWRFVQPASGVIRRVMLGMVRRAAERPKSARTKPSGQGS